MPIKGEIINEIVNEIYVSKPKNDYFYKTEVELAKEFRCSRQTIREVIKSLVSEGYLWKNKNGKIIINEPEWIEGFIKFNDIHHKEETYKLDSKELLDINNEIRFYFSNTALASTYWRIERTIEHSSTEFEVIFLPNTIFKNVEQIKNHRKVQEFLKATYPVKINYALKEIEAVQLNSELQKKLKTDKKTGLLIITKYFFNNDRLGCVTLNYTTERKFTKVMNYEDF